MSKLIGSKYMVQGKLVGIDTKVLWDTGSQVPIVLTNWLMQHCPHHHIRPVTYC
ncbi:hypothetical protein HOLleu_26749 [Holothuria leucospilota]|uniref:Uncharacterized protein n=1 Tax=Holothuria leucospilota TaxID=206669 RepID=A0A9Q1BPL8_HOLLE|nr:hypothetical protein HOLleu_26749 [Holothuria leucospilota]